MNAHELAEKVDAIANDCFHPSYSGPQTFTKRIEALLTEFAKEIREEVHKEIAAKQAVVYGESVMIDGKVLTNEELYKQPTDYIKEAVAQEREKCAKVCEDYGGIVGACPECGNNSQRDIAAQIRARGTQA